MSRKHSLRTGLVFVLLAGVASVASAQAPPVPQPELMLPDPEVLEQGPLHEAFAEPLALDQEQPVLVAQEPPEAVQEIPPAERPEGGNVVWIPGYFMWDPDRADFIWVSGLWRDVPPGRTWIPGEWQPVPGGWQWVHGFWADARQEQLALLPAPPATLEEGPSSPAPGEDFLWAPGTWLWQNTGYAWQAGYWYQARPNWVWVPSHYAYTPRGVFFVSGYWDYPPVARAVLYAPVYWSGGFAGFGSACYYRPVSIVNTGLLIANLFVHHGHHHYYFGYGYGGYPSWLTPWGYGFARWGYHHGHHLVYDPWWSYYRWHDRHDFDHHGHWKYQQKWDHGHGKGGDHDLADRPSGPHRKPTHKASGMVVRSVDELKRTVVGAPKLRQLSETEVNKYRQGADKFRNFDRNRIMDSKSVTSNQLEGAGQHGLPNGTARVLRHSDQGSGQTGHREVDHNLSGGKALQGRVLREAGQLDSRLSGKADSSRAIPKYGNSSARIHSGQDSERSSQVNSSGNQRATSQDSWRQILGQQDGRGGAQTLDSWSQGAKRTSVGRTQVNSGHSAPQRSSHFPGVDNLQLQRREFPSRLPEEGSANGQALQRTMRLPVRESAGPQINHSWQGRSAVQNRQTYSLPQGNFPAHQGSFRAGQMPQQLQSRTMPAPQRVQGSANNSAGQMRSGNSPAAGGGRALGGGGGGGGVSGGGGGSGHGGGGRRSR